MEQSIKAIETQYRVYRFRSRLEARWAVFFDALHLDWEYESEGFDLGDGILYLPDFYLELEKGKPRIWTEVKPNVTEAFNKADDILSTFVLKSKETALLLIGAPGNLCLIYEYSPEVILHDGLVMPECRTARPAGVDLGAIHVRSL